MLEATRIDPTKKPTGLTITRDGYKFICSWTIADEDYGAGINFEYRTKKYNGEWRSYNSVTVSKTATTATISLTASDFYPVTNKHILEFEFRVRGRRKKYSYINKKQTLKTNVEPSVSEWASKSMSIYRPRKPSLDIEFTAPQTSVFNWAVEANATDQYMYHNIKWESMLIAESSETDGSKLNWESATTGTSSNQSGSQTFVETSTAIATGSHTRWFRVSSWGVRGASDWRYSKHIYAKPNTPQITAYTVTETPTGYTADVSWKISTNPAYPVDECMVQYATEVPDAGMVLPANPSWSDGAYSVDGKSTGRVVFNITGKLEDDECLFFRVVATHDDRETASDYVLAKKGILADPSTPTVTLNGNVATVTATNNSNACEYTGSSTTINRLYLAVYYKGRKFYKNGINIGVIPYGSTSAQITLPDMTDETYYQIGVKAFVGTYSYTTTNDGTRRYTYNYVMESANSQWFGARLAKPPTGLKASYRDDRKVALSWVWAWEDADSVELSWSDDPYAWESTNEPETYTINRQVEGWNIYGLQAGMRYYFRARLILESEDLYSTYSNQAELYLTLPPQKPVLSVSDSLIIKDGKVVCSWRYISGDGTDQSYAEILANNTVVARLTSQQMVTLYAEDLGWIAGTSYSLKLRVKSESGSFSEYSDIVTVKVAEPVEALISDDSLETITVGTGESERQEVSLTEMPLTVTVEGAGTYGTTIVSIERAESYRMDRPDESVFDGYEGEQIYRISQQGDATITINIDDIYGSLDDGAKYKIVATVKDGLGQNDTVEEEFYVHWTHQAVMPEATSVFEDDVVKLTIEEPTGYEAGDYCDIYRLTADRPELIFPNAQIGETYVDPYPAINGGHRVVYRTSNGDYITDDKHIAWLDLEDGFEYDKAIINFGTDTVELYYNVDTNHAWEKDFKETKYLGGSVQGDWNPAVSRSGSVSAVVLNPLETETITALRRLADYAGICHIRTKDGSSFSADVQVTESRPHDRYGLISEFTLNYTRVDPQGYDGMTLDTWEALNELE